MDLVVDANIVFAALIKKGWTFDFIWLLSNRGFKLYSPSYLLVETNKRIDRLMEFSGLNKLEIEELMNIISEKIKVVPKEKYNALLTDGKELLPDHPKDAPYFALALYLRCSIWSNEKRLKEQKKVKIYSTTELKAMY